MEENTYKMKFAQTSFNIPIMIDRFVGITMLVAGDKPTNYMSAHTIGDNGWARHPFRNHEASCPRRNFISHVDMTSSTSGRGSCSALRFDPLSWDMYFV
jgi:hypothetical protein